MGCGLLNLEGAVFSKSVRILSLLEMKGGPHETFRPWEGGRSGPDVSVSCSCWVLVMLRDRWPIGPAHGLVPWAVANWP